MFLTFANDIISSYFKDIRNLLYEADGRIDNPPEDLLDYNYNKVGNLTMDNNENSRITISSIDPLNTCKAINSNNLNNFQHVSNYKRDFIDLPFNVTPSSNITEINSKFYEYSVRGNYKEITKDSIDLLNYRIRDNTKMHRSDFLYMMVINKYCNMVDEYPKCLKSAKEYFHLKKKTKEEIVLKNLILFYSELLNSEQDQLCIFLHTENSKQVADIYTNILIEFLTLRLNILSPETDNPYFAQPQGMIADEEIGKSIVYELPKDFALEDLKIKSKAINAKQTVILFHYLRKYDAIIDHSNASYALLVNLLTGCSHKQLRTTKGFGNITGILGKTIKGVKSANLKVVKTLLEKILSDIDKEISEQA